jgi:uncharacterized protein (DUF885 family)
MAVATSKKILSRSRRSTRGRANPIDDALARLEREIPRLLRQLRANVRDLQGQVVRARADGEKRWQQAERKLKKDATQIRQRVEKKLESAIGRMRGKRKAARPVPKSKAKRAAGSATTRKAKAPKRRKTTRKRSA